MKFHSGRGARRGWVLPPAALLLAAVAVGCGPAPEDQPVPGPITLPSPSSGLVQPPPPPAEPAALAQPADAPDPVRVRLPAIAVDAPVIPLGLDVAGALEVPADYGETGWFAGGPEPGELDRADGSVVAFAVERLEQHPKNAFPTQSVYGPTAAATLRLVTCGGTFDGSVGHYRDNIIVYAVAQ